MLNRYGDTEEYLLHMQRVAGSILSQGKWCLEGFSFGINFLGYVPTDINFKGYLN